MRQVVLGALAALVGAAWCEAARVAVVLREEAAVAVVDLESGKVVGKVAVGEGPKEIVALPDGKTVYVSNYGSAIPGNTISVIDVEGLTEVTRIDLGWMRRPHGLVEYGGNVFFTAEHVGIVGRINGRTNKVDWATGTGQGGSHLLKVDALSGRLFTANVLSDTVTFLDPPEMPGPVLPGHVDVGVGPEGIAVSPDGRHLWVGHRLEGRITVIDTRTERSLSSFAIGGMPVRMAFTPDGKYVLAADPASGKLVRMDAEAMKEVDRLDIGAGVVGIAFSGDGKTAFVSCLVDNSISLLDLETFKVTKKVAVAGIPDGLALLEPREQVLPRMLGSLGVGIGMEHESVVLSQIGKGSAAEKAGLKPGDLLVSVDGAEISTPQLLQRIVRRSRAGDELEFVVKRAEKLVPLKVTLLPVPTGAPGQG
jgi:YVTN family beta-propeller protein